VQNQQLQRCKLTRHHHSAASHLHRAPDCCAADHPSRCCQLLHQEAPELPAADSAAVAAEALQHLLHALLPRVQVQWQQKGIRASARALLCGG
jgi:hypothetical protein